ncbi:MAG TPA: VTT domain-containing protein [Bryobacteraceae bacterium]|jgi:membrane protein DedA with SNARE-associated domain
MRPLLHKIAVALAAYGPWGVLLLSALDSLGIPLPATIDLLVIGVAATSAQSPGHAYITALLAVLGSTVGNIALFQGARHGRRLFSKGEPQPGRSQRFQKWFYRYGLLTVFLPAVVPVIPLPLKVFVISAGALRTPFVRFLGIILLARVIRYFGLAYLGIQLGEDAQGFLQRNGWTLTGVALGLTLVLCFLIRYNDRRSELS